MKLMPIPAAHLSQYPRWDTHLARSFRSTVIVAATSLLTGVLGCAATPPGVMIAPTVPVDGEAQSEQPADVREEWVQIPIYIIFDRHASILDDDDEALLHELHDMLSHRTDVLRIRVLGFTIPRDEPESGLALARAEAVIDFMVTELGMPSEMLEAIDRGGEEPWGDLAPTDYPQHRRVELQALVRRER